MITRNTKTPWSSILIPGGMMKKPQTSWERSYLQEFLPANFTSGKSAIGYEFCYPSVVARQLGFVQIPPLPYFADKVQGRNPIGKALAYNRLKRLEPVIDMTQLADWQVAPLTTIPFTQWWSEWQEHLFCGSLKVYCIALDEDYQGADDEVRTKISFVASPFSYCSFIFWQILATGWQYPTSNGQQKRAADQIFPTNKPSSHRLWCTNPCRCRCWQKTQDDQY